MSLSSGTTTRAKRSEKCTRSRERNQIQPRRFERRQQPCGSKGTTLPDVRSGRGSKKVSNWRVLRGAAATETKCSGAVESARLSRSEGRWSLEVDDSPHLDPALCSESTVQPCDVVLDSAVTVTHAVFNRGTRVGCYGRPSTGPAAAGLDALVER
jgi:hypothetical protein